MVTSDATLSVHFTKHLSHHKARDPTRPTFSIYLLSAHWALRVAQWSAHPSLSMLREDDQVCCNGLSCPQPARSCLLLK